MSSKRCSNSSDSRMTSFILCKQMYCNAAANQGIIYTLLLDTSTCKGTIEPKPSWHDYMWSNIMQLHIATEPSSKSHILGMCPTLHSAQKARATLEAAE